MKFENKTEQMRAEAYEAAVKNRINAMDKVFLINLFEEQLNCIDEVIMGAREIGVPNVGALEKMKAEVIQKEGELLESHGFPADYLIPKWPCETCGKRGECSIENDEECPVVAAFVAKR